MGNQAQGCALPDGVGGEVLREMMGPKRIVITDRFWFELLKVQLPGVGEAGFFDRHYERPDELDSLIRDSYFLQLVATNEHSGNFRTFMRFWARLLHYYRTSPRDAKPCSAVTILSLSLLCRCLVKQFAETFSLPELLFQLEQAQHETAGGEGELPAVPDGSLLVTYCGKRVMARLPNSDAAAGSNCVGSGREAASACLEPFCGLFPEDSALLHAFDRCALRAVAHGETFAAADVLEHVGELGAQELVVCPSGVPHARGSVLRGVFREVVDFLVSSSFGAVSGASPSLLMDGDCDSMDGHPAARNLSLTPHTMQLQAVLLEIILALGAVIAPRYGAPPAASAVSSARDPQAPHTSNGKSASSSTPAQLSSPGLAPGSATPSVVAGHRADFIAPFLFGSRERRAAAKAAAARAIGKAPGAETQRTEVCVCGRPFPANSFVCGKCGSGRACEDLLSRDAAPGCKTAPGDPRVRLFTFGPEGDTEAPALSVPLPPAADEMPSLPFLDALLQVVGAPREEETSPDDASGDDVGGGAGGRSDGASASDAAPPASDDGQAASRRGTRAEALLASLLNCIWLEPHAASLPRPPKEVVRLLSGVALPLSGSSPPMDDAATDVLPAAADEKAAGREATSAAGRLTHRALVVLLLIVFHDSQSHPAIGRAFACLADPLLGVNGKVSHTGAAAPLNFTQLLRTVLARLNEGLYDLLLYCLVHKNEKFRSYCLCRADADEVLVPILTVLHMLPCVVEGMTLAAPPASSLALLLTLLALTGDRGFCESASRTHVKDGGPVLGKSRPLPNISVSSLLVAVLIRLSHWNFGACRDVFFNKAVAGVFGNLARHGAEQLHWYAASRMLEMAQLLSKNNIKDVYFGCTTSAERRRAGMVRELLRSLTRLMSGCLRLPFVARNCSLVYAFQRVYPPQFAELEADADFGPALRHIRAVIDWFQVQCPPDVEGSDWEGQVARLEAAAPRVPGSVDALAGWLNTTGHFAYAETATVSSYFLPVVWRAARQLLPDHVCWTRPGGGRPIRMP